jgi:hypothetical protein
MLHCLGKKSLAWSDSQNALRLGAAQSPRWALLWDNVSDEEFRAYVGFYARRQRQT